MLAMTSDSHCEECNDDAVLDAKGVRATKSRELSAEENAELS